MNLPRVIGVTGYAQHGKDTLGDQLVLTYGYTKVAFATALKALAITLDPCVPTAADGTLTVVPGGLQTSVIVQRLSQLVATEGWEAAKEHPEVRRFLQVLGTEGVRAHVGEDSWVRALLRTMDYDGKYVITDVRFPNEESAVHRHLDGLVFRVNRLNADGTPFDNGIGTDHTSEMHIADLDVDADLFASTPGELWTEFLKSVGA